MILISKIASYIPQGRLHMQQIKERFGFKDEFIANQLGFQALARKSSSEDTSDLCAKAFECLQKTGVANPADVELIVVCTQNPDGSGLPHTAAIVHGKVGAPSACAAFDIGLGCSGYVYGLSIATSFMQANGLKTGLLFTADPYSKIVNENDRDTAALFGDAATVTLLSAHGELPGFRPYGFKFYTDGSRMNALHADGGRLYMNGRDVFMFAAKVVPELFRSLLADQEITVADMDLVLLHPGSLYIVETLIERLGLPRDKTPFSASMYGNTVSSSIPLAFEPYLEMAPKRGIMCGFGVGLSAAVCAFEHISSSTPP